MQRTLYLKMPEEMRIEKLGCETWYYVWRRGHRAQRTLIWRDFAIYGPIRIAAVSLKRRAAQ